MARICCAAQGRRSWPKSTGTAGSPSRSCNSFGIETSYQLDGFLKAHDICIEITPLDPERERRSPEGNAKLTGADLIAAIQCSPYRDLEIEPERYRFPVRAVSV